MSRMLYTDIFSKLKLHSSRKSIQLFVNCNGFQELFQRSNCTVSVKTLMTTFSICISKLFMFCCVLCFAVFYESVILIALLIQCFLDSFRTDWDSSKLAYRCQKDHIIAKNGRLRYKGV